MFRQQRLARRFVPLARGRERGFLTACQPDPIVAGRRAFSPGDRLKPVGSGKSAAPKDPGHYRRDCVSSGSRNDIAEAVRRHRAAEARETRAGGVIICAVPLRFLVLTGNDAVVDRQTFLALPEMPCAPLRYQKCNRKDRVTG
jgi:hypothetical protein